MSLVTTQLDKGGNVTKYRSFKTLREGSWVVMLEIQEGYVHPDGPNWAGGKARRTTFLRLTPETAKQLGDQLARLTEDM